MLALGRDDAASHAGERDPYFDIGRSLVMIQVVPPFLVFGLIFSTHTFHTHALDGVMFSCKVL
jgi:hypothetical protein